MPFSHLRVSKYHGKEKKTRGYLKEACLRLTSVSCHAELGRGQLVVWRTTSEIRTKGCIFGKSENTKVMETVAEFTNGFIIR